MVADWPCRHGKAKCDLDTPAAFRYFPAPYHGATGCLLLAVPRTAAPGPWARIQDLILPIGMIASVLVIMVPVPAELMDLLLAANITIAVIMLLTTLYVRTPLEFNIFPSLLAGHDAVPAGAECGHDAADPHPGRHATACWRRAAWCEPSASSSPAAAAGADNIVVGLIIFSIIVVIQFVVITKGATRISEVAARFTLDGMPGKQMAIDADLNAGMIDQREAQRRRQESHAAGRLLRRDGRRQQVRPRRRHRGHHHHSDQHRRRTVHRHRPERHEPEPGRRAVHHAYDRRRAGDAGARVSDFAGGRHVGHAEQPGEQSAERVLAAAFFAPAGVGRRGRFSGHSDLHQPAADSAVADRRRPARAWP